MPKFNKKRPKNRQEYFDPASDEAFKAAHPIGYPVLVTVGLLAFIAPMIGLMIFDGLTGSGRRDQRGHGVQPPETRQAVHLVQPEQ